MRVIIASIFIVFVVTTGLSKSNIAILPLNSSCAEIDSLIVATLTEKIKNLLVESNAFNVVEREKVEEILTEQGLQQTGCITTDCIVNAGQLLGVQELIAGRIGKIGKYYILTLNRIDVGTGKIIRSVEEKSDEQLSEIFDRYIGKLVNTLSQSVVPGSIVVETNCFDAQIFLNDVQHCTGNCKIDSLLPGEYEVTADLPSARSNSSTVFVNSNIVTKVKIDVANPYENWKSYFISGGLIVLTGGILFGVSATEATGAHGPQNYKSISLAVLGVSGCVAGTIFFIKSSRSYHKKIQWNAKYADKIGFGLNNK